MVIFMLSFFYHNFLKIVKTIVSPRAVQTEVAAGSGLWAIVC